MQMKPQPSGQGASFALLAVAFRPPVRAGLRLGRGFAVMRHRDLCEERPQLFATDSAGHTCTALRHHHRDLVAITLEQGNVGCDVDLIDRQAVDRSQILKQRFRILAQVTARLGVQHKPATGQGCLPEARKQVGNGAERGHPEHADHQPVL